MRRWPRKRASASQIAPSGTTMIDGNRSLISPGAGQSGRQRDQVHAVRRQGDRDRVRTRRWAPNCAWPTPVRAFDANERARVVERFVRLEASRNSPGTGLGLSLVAAVARLHDARLLLEDNKPGLRAVIRFPRPAPSDAARCPQAVTF